jgi:predicted metal-binding membrane protein
MSATVLARSERAELAAAFAAARVQPRVILTLLLTAGLAWWLTTARMAGMDAGPGTSLGPFGWFVGVWAMMMAAMMLPSLTPTAALHASEASRRPLREAALFAVGYLLVWSVVGTVAYALFALGKSLVAAQLAWHAGGRPLAAAVLALAALYELSPAKRACLTKCRSPRLFLRRARREERLRPIEMGVRNGCWCLGCSSALMAALFALGVMSVAWMALIALLVSAQKLLPSRRVAVTATAALLLALAIGVLVAPHDVPGLVVPGHAAHAMKAMT